VGFFLIRLGQVLCPFLISLNHGW